MSSSFESYQRSPFRSVKHSTYFDVYDKLFSPLVGKKITFVEVGVLGGGSLFMWRDFFGESARIIGIDLNPAAKKWEEHGFEILIGNQADPAFWREVFGFLGPIDVLLDDGGHTYLQQAVTFNEAHPFIKDGGLLVVEDTHTSYMRGFGPKRFSFVSLAKSVVDLNNNRFGGLRPPVKDSGSWSVEFFESFVVFHINRSKSNRVSTPTDNGGQDDQAVDYRDEGHQSLQRFDALVDPLKLKAFAPTRIVVGGIRSRLFDWFWDRPRLAKLFRGLRKL